MNSKKNTRKTKDNTFKYKTARGFEKEFKNNNKTKHAKKNFIESYNNKKNKLNSLKNTTFDNKANLSLSSFAASNISQEDKIVNTSLKTTKETENNQLKDSNNKKNRNDADTPALLLNKEIDKFENRIKRLLKIIEDFEMKYINSPERKKIQKELNEVKQSRKYLNNVNINIKLQKKKKETTRESQKKIANKEKNSNKAIKIKKKKLNLKNNPLHNLFLSTKNIKNKNNKKESTDANINNIEDINIIRNSYSRRINYSHLLDIKSTNKEKNPNTIVKKEILTHHFPSKSNGIEFNQNIYEETKIKDKNFKKSKINNKTNTINREKEKNINNINK